MCHFIPSVVRRVVRFAVLFAFVAIPARLVAQIHPPVIHPLISGGVDVELKGGGPVVVAPSGGSSATFMITNTRPISTTYTLSCTPTGAVSSCTPTDGSLTLDPHETQTEGVSFTAGSSAGSGLIILYATGAASDSGTYNITVAAVNSPPLSQPRQPDSVFNHAHCVTSAAGIADWSCGDAMFLLSTPSYTTLDRARAMTLAYASSTAAPQPLVSVNVTLDSTQPPLDRVRAVLTVHDTVRTNVAYTSWSNATRQLVLGWSAGATPTGAYPYTLTVYVVAGSDSASSSVSGLLYLVNRSASSYGAGWEWLGVERLILHQPIGSGSSNLMWVDGDGSAKLYSQLSTNVWVAPHEAYQDTITFASGEYTRTLRHGVQVIFDSTGRHVRTNNRQTQVTHFYWGTASRLDSVRVPPAGSGGKTFTMLYNGSGFLDSVLVGGRNIGITDASGFMTQWRWPDSTSTTNLTFHADSAGRIDSTLDARGGATRLHYALYGLVDTAKIWYDSSSSHIAAITKFTPWQSVGYAGSALGDTAKAFTSIVGPRGVGDSAEFHVDKWGAPILAKDPDLQTTKYVRGSSRTPAMVTEIDFPNSRKAFMTYDTLANLLTLTDSSWGTNAFPLQKTRWTYHDTNDLFSPDSMIAPDGTLNRYAYTSLGLTDSMIDPRGHVTKFTYASSDDSVRGQVLSVTERAVPTWIQSMAADRDTDLVTTLAYDASGNSVKAQSPAGGITKYQRVATSGLVNQIDDAVGFRQQVVYDLMDHVVRKVAIHAVGDSSTACLTNEFICASLLIPALNPPGSADTTAATYTHGLLTKVLDPRHVPHSYGYDLRGLLVADSDEAGHADVATYDRGGLVAKQLTRNGPTLSFSYDATGRQTRWIIPADTLVLFGATVIAPLDTVLSTYDSLGNLLVHRSRQGTITRSYFENGAMHVQQTADTGAAAGMDADTVSYAYGTGGRLTSLSWPRGDTTRYGYDATTGDVDSVTGTWTGSGGTRTELFRLVTDAMGRRRSVLYPFDGTTDTLSYDRLGVLRRLRVVNSDLAAGNLFKVTMTQDSVDVLGRALHRLVVCDGTSIDSATVGAPCGSWAPYESWPRYNRLGELVVEARRQFFGQTPTSDTLRYDQSGNRDTAVYPSPGPGKRTVFSYPSASNRPSTATDSFFTSHATLVTTYSYDLAGTRIKDTLAGKYVQAYEYDAAGRMRGTARVEPGFVAFPLDSVGFATIDTVRSPNSCDYNADAQLVRGCGVALTSYVGNNVVREHDGDWWYVTGPGLDDPILAVKRGFQGVANTTEAALPVVSDGRGQLITIADSSGQIQGGVTAPGYDAGLWNSSGLTGHAQSFNPRRWAMTGGIDTISTFRSRQYDPATGKWLQEDPAGLAGGVNLYEYNGNDPNSLSDPFGLAPCEPPGSAKCKDALIPEDPIGFILGLVVVPEGEAVEGLGVASKAGRPLIAGAKHEISEGLRRVTAELSDKALAKTYRGAINQINRHKELLKTALDREIAPIMADIVKHEKRLQAAVEEMLKRGIHP